MFDEMLFLFCFVCFVIFRLIFVLFLKLDRKGIINLLSCSKSLFLRSLKKLRKGKNKGKNIFFQEKRDFVLAHIC